MSRRAVPLLAILCLAACAAMAAAAAAAPKGYASPTFHKYMIDARFGQLPLHDAAAAGGKASVASAAQDASEADYYNQYGYNNYRESKQVCLAEQRQRNCGMYGCQQRVRNGCCSSGSSGGNCDAGNTGTGCDRGCECYNCRIGNTYTSDFTCMREEHYYSGYGDDGPTRFFQTHGMVGSCDWSIMWLRHDASDTGGNNGADTCPNANSPDDASDNTCGWQNVNSVGSSISTFKVGTATGTCYLNADAQTCGEPLCNRLMVTLQGDVYVTRAFSHDNTGSFTNRDACTCFAWDNIDNNDCATVSDIPPWANLTSLTRTQGRRLSQADEAGAKVEAANYGGYNNYNHAASPQTVYFGGAVIISGAVTSINGQAYESKYEDGLFEYVPYFFNYCTVGGTAANCPTSVDATLPFVKPNSYKLEFSKDGVKYYSN